ncbi:MAG: roadblock/LC7 domain-containing protein [Actinomycetota bacterium]|nr:roadblock/LC7 domain-containing protein [Actinomycetota bacterium]
MTKADQLAAALDDLLAVSQEIEAAAVVSSDGLPMASALPPHVEEDRLAAMSAALLALGERAAQEMGKGDLSQVFVEGSTGHVVLMAAGDYAVLVAMTSHDAKVGLVLFEMRRSAGRVAHIMDSSAQDLFDVAGEPILTASMGDVDDSVQMRAPEPQPAAETQPEHTMQDW